MSDQFWTTLRPVRKVGKLRGIITIPTFSEICGFAKNSLNIGLQKTTENISSSGANLNISGSTITVECNIRTKSTNQIQVLRQSNNAGTLIWSIDVLASVVTATIVTSTTTYSITANIAYNNWVHIAFSYDGTTLKLYADGHLVSSIAATGTLGAVTPKKLFIGNNPNGGGDSYPFQISHVRIWNITRTAEDIALYITRAIGPSTTGLKAYWKMIDSSGTTITDSGPSGYDIDFSAYDYVYSWNTDDGVPILLGVSFAALVFDIEVIGHDYWSIKYPLTKPYEDVNFVPVISWIDSVSGDRVRYKLWDIDPTIDYAPEIPLYNGEAIPAYTALLEIFNIDGNETVDLTQSVDIETSILHVQTDSNNITPSVDDTILDNISISSLYPLVFPIVFDQPIVI